jgi:hypothetical protein
MAASVNRRKDECGNEARPACSGNRFCRACRARVTLRSGIRLRNKKYPAAIAGPKGTQASRASVRTAGSEPARCGSAQTKHQYSGYEPESVLHVGRRRIPTQENATAGEPTCGHV